MVFACNDLILQAEPAGPGASVAPTLLEWGRDTQAIQGSKYPVLYRVFGLEVQIALLIPLLIDSMVHIRNGNVIGDNMWLWRADRHVSLSRTAAIDVVMEWLLIGMTYQCMGSLLSTQKKI